MQFKTTALRSDMLTEQAIFLVLFSSAYQKGPEKSVKYVWPSHPGFSVVSVVVSYIAAQFSSLYLSEVHQM